MGLGLAAWPSGAFEIREGGATWRPTLDITRILLAALGVGLALGMALITSPLLIVATSPSAGVNATDSTRSES